MQASLALHPLHLSGRPAPSEFCWSIFGSVVLGAVLGGCTLYIARGQHHVKYNCPSFCRHLAAYLPQMDCQTQQPLTMVSLSPVKSSRSLWRKLASVICSMPYALSCCNQPFSRKSFFNSDRWTEKNLIWIPTF